VKPIKMFGLVALAASVAMALAGADSAMAESTELCAVDESPCDKPVTEIHEVSDGVRDHAKLSLRDHRKM